MFFPQVLAHVGSGTYEPLQILPPVAVAVAYAARARHLAHLGRPVPLWRKVCFMAGVFAILAALASPLAHLSEELFFAHMAEHLAIGDIGALLIVLGLTGPILQPILGFRVIDRLRVLSHPLVALPLWAVNLYVWHLPALYQATLTSAPVHALQHVLFIGLGIAMWMPLFGPLPMPEWFGNAAKLIYIIVVRLTGAVLANVFIWSGTVFYPRYGSGEHVWGISPLADQGAAGNVMMLEGSLLTLGLFAWLFFKAARDSEEKQELVELAEAHGVQLDEARARRAIAAGRGEQLRERVLAAAKRGVSTLRA